MKGSRVFAPDFILPAYAYYFFFLFGLAFSPISLGCFPRVAPSAFSGGGVSPRRGRAQPRCLARALGGPGAAQPRPGDAAPRAVLPSLAPRLSCLCFPQAFLLMFHTFKECSAAAAAFLFFFPFIAFLAP